MRIRISGRCLTGIWLAAALLLMALPGAAQVSSVSGKVTDSSGAVIPGATVTLTNDAGTSRAAVSDDVGVYQFLQVAPGAYSMKAELRGFKTTSAPKVTLAVDTPVLQNFVMDVGEITEVVTVEAGAVTLNTQDATLGNAIGGLQIKELPLQSRNVAGLLSLQAAVTPDGYVSGSRSDQSNMTLDGIDVNDQQDGDAFQSVIRINPDSVQEFRVTTAVTNASQGRSSGGQVSLITRTGTNEYHGALYWYFRTTGGTANNFFNNRSGIDRPELRRDLFGGSFSGPILKDRAFFFYNYEGRKDDKQTSILQTVPTASLGLGEVKYPNTSGGITTLTIADINRIYPVGANPVAIAVLADAAKRYPANDTGAGDQLNTSGYRFNAPLPVKQNAHTATLNFNLTRDGTHQLLLRGNYQHDHDNGAPAFPDTASTNYWSHPAGYALQHTWTISSNMVNTLRYGLTRMAFSNQGDTGGNYVTFRFVYSPTNGSFTTNRITPTHNIVDDFSWIKGDHTIQFGTNIRVIRNTRQALGHSYDRGVMNPSFYELSGDVLTDPLTDLGGNKAGAQAGLTAVIGRLSQYSGNYNFGASGDILSVGDPVARTFATEEYEFYGQDSWRINPSLTLTLGLRWGVNTPVYETNGLMVTPTVSLGDYFELRKAGAAKGVPYNEPITIDLAGPSYNRPGFYPMDKNNFAPRVAAAWSPDFESGFLKTIFGSGRKSVFRGGFAMTYDRVGSRLAVDFDLNNTLGFSSTQTIAANTYNVTDRPGPLFTGLGMNIRDLPKIEVPDKITFPLQTPSDEDQRIESSLDDTIRSPINYSWDFSIGRELGHGLTLELSYIGREARDLLASRDIMALNNLVDPNSGVDWYTAAGQLVDLRNANTPITSVQKIAYFENIFPLMAGKYTVLGQSVDLTATQAAYRRVARSAVGGRNTADYTYVQLLWDDGYGYGDNLFFHPQYAALAAKSTVAYSNYHAGTLSLRQRLSSLSLDFNYTFSKSHDNASGLETSGAYGSAFIENSLRPDDQYSVSDFDISHMINASSVWEFPFGRGKRWASSLPAAADALLGGWQLTSIFRWNSGTPESAPFDAQVWATNWNAQSWGSRIREVSESATKGGDHPNFFKDPVAAYQSFRNARPGETGERNIFRIPAYVALDFGLGKSVRIPGTENHKVQFRWEVFNATNTQRLDGPTISRAGFGLDVDPMLGLPAPEFGRINSIQGSPRIMQWAIRYDF